MDDELTPTVSVQNHSPLASLDDWDDDVRRRYPDPETTVDADDEAFRDYSENTCPKVREFYRQNHLLQTVAFNQEVRQKYLPLRNCRMGIWDAIRRLDEIIDDSDPDTELPQIEHAIQTAEQVRADGHPDWFVLTGLIHDLGKVLCLFGEPQWAVVGDTFPVGCQYSSKIVFPEFFSDNPDSNVPEYQTPDGIYESGCGLDNVMLSWGHDEYMYHVTKDYLPRPAQYIIRYHSFYACHRERDYEYLMNDEDREMFNWVRRFNPYDLYTKAHDRPDLNRLLPEYEQLVSNFFPADLQW